MGPVVTFLVASANWDHDYLYYMEIWSPQRVAEASCFRYGIVVISAMESLDCLRYVKPLVASATLDLLPQFVTSASRFHDV